MKKILILTVILALVSFQPYFSIEKALADMVTATDPIYTNLTSADLATNPFFKLGELGIKYNLAFPLASDGIVAIKEYSAAPEMITLGQKNLRLEIFKTDITYNTAQTDSTAKFAAENPMPNYTWLQKINGEWQKKTNLEIAPGRTITLARAKIINESYNFPDNVADGKISFTNFDLRVKTAPISPLTITANWEETDDNVSNLPLADGALNNRYVFYQPFSIALASPNILGKLGQATVGEITIATPDIDDFRKPIIYLWNNATQKFVAQDTFYNFNGKRLSSLKTTLNLYEKTIIAVISSPTERIGEASWYKVFGCLCAASRHYPRGSRLKVTAVNPTKGKAKSVIVRVNDFGPEDWTGRLIDLDSYAYKKLGSTVRGVMPVMVELVDPKTPVSVDDKPEKDKPIKLGATIYIPFQMTPAMLAKE